MFGAGRQEDKLGQGEVLPYGRTVRKYKGSRRPPGIDPDVWARLFTTQERKRLIDEYQAYLDGLKEARASGTPAELVEPGLSEGEPATRSVPGAPAAPKGAADAGGSGAQLFVVAGAKLKDSFPTEQLGKPVVISLEETSQAPELKMAGSCGMSGAAWGA